MKQKFPTQSLPFLLLATNPSLVDGGKSTNPTLLEITATSTNIDHLGYEFFYCETFATASYSNKKIYIM